VAIPAGFFRVNTYRVTPFIVPFGRPIHDYTQTKGIFIDVSGQTVADPFVTH
jgi:hypothetical protein